MSILATLFTWGLRFSIAFDPSHSTHRIKVQAQLLHYPSRGRLLLALVLLLLWMLLLQPTQNAAQCQGDATFYLWQERLLGVERPSAKLRTSSPSIPRHHHRRLYIRCSSNRLYTYSWHLSIRTTHNSLPNDNIWKNLSIQITSFSMDFRLALHCLPNTILRYLFCQRERKKKCLSEYDTKCTFAVNSHHKAIDIHASTN